MTENGFRVEADLLGKRSIPSEAYYGVHTLRAKENFDISGRTIASLPFLVMALAAVKEAAADANCELGLLPRPLRDAIAAACVEIREGRLHDQFERLRAEGRYERMRETIQARDVSWAGSVNPMLTRHGERSEAPQYSGRQVPDDWACPFQRRAVELRREAGPIAADLRGGAFRVPPATRRSPSAADRTP